MGPYIITEVIPGGAYCWCRIDEVIIGQLGTPRGRYDEYSSKVFPQLRNQGLSIRRRADNTTEGDADWLSDSFGQIIYGASSKLCFASSNVKPAHNTIKYFVPNLR
jgi:hypothetical protein